MTARNPRLRPSRAAIHEAHQEILTCLEQAGPEGEPGRVIAGLTGIHVLDIGELLGDLRESGHIRRLSGEPGAPWALVPGAPR